MGSALKIGIAGLGTVGAGVVKILRFTLQINHIS